MPIEKARQIDSNRRQELKSQLGDCLREVPESITLEIGCGHGHFLASYAEAHPREYCLGIDIIEDRLLRAERKIRRAELSNVSFVRGEARMLLETLPKSINVGRTFILFPDPWPKRKHHKNRLISAEFLSLLADRSAPEAKLFFRTDFEPYFASVGAFLEVHPDWIIANEDWPFEHETVFQERASSYRSWVATRR